MIYRTKTKRNDDEDRSEVLWCMRRVRLCRLLLLRVRCSENTCTISQEFTMIRKVQNYIYLIFYYHWNRPKFYKSLFQYKETEQITRRRTHGHLARSPIQLNQSKSVNHSARRFTTQYMERLRVPLWSKQSRQVYYDNKSKCMRVPVSQ
jgi:hypothetical protein